MNKESVRYSAALSGDSLYSVKDDSYLVIRDASKSLEAAMVSPNAVRCTI
ncbi:hypothetical protein [Klebsiella aerogenes]